MLFIITENPQCRTMCVLWTTLCIFIEVSTFAILPRTISTGQLESFDLSRGKEASKVLIKQIKEDVAT